MTATATRPTDTTASSATPLGGPVAPRTTCPYCQRPVPGLLSGCEQGECRRLELDADRAIERANDI